MNEEVEHLPNSQNTFADLGLAITMCETYVFARILCSDRYTVSGHSVSYPR